MWVVPKENTGELSKKLAYDAVWSNTPGKLVVYGYLLDTREVFFCDDLEVEAGMLNFKTSLSRATRKKYGKKD